MRLICKPVLLILLIGILLASPIRYVMAGDLPEFQIQQVLAQDADAVGYAVPTLTVTPDGSVLMFTVAKIGKVRDAGVQSFTTMLRSTDGGKTWQDKKHFYVDGVAGELWQALSDEKTGRIWALNYPRPILTDEGKPVSEWWMIHNPDKAHAAGGCALMYYSDDNGVTWSDPIDLSDQLYTYPGAGLAWNIGHGIQLKRGNHKGRLIFPARFFGTATDKGVNEDDHNTVIYSDDHGKTWQFGGAVQGYTGEGVIAELPDGSVYLNSRSHHPEHGNLRAWAISHDGGKTFVEKGYDPALIDPKQYGGCHAGLVEAHDAEGNPLLLFCNPADPDKRKQLVVRLSRDGGKTWPISRTVWHGPAGYSDIQFTHDGRILCAFETGRNEASRGTVMVASFSLDWLMQEK